MTNPVHLSHIPILTPIYSDLPISPSDSKLGTLLGCTVVLIGKNTVIDRHGEGRGSFLYEIPGKLTPAVYTGFIENYEPHGYGTLRFPDGTGEYEGPFSKGIPQGFGIHRSLSGKILRIGQLFFEHSLGCSAFILDGPGEMNESHTPVAPSLRTPGRLIAPTPPTTKKAGLFRNDFAKGGGMTPLSPHPVRFLDDAVTHIYSGIIHEFKFLLDQMKITPLDPKPTQCYMQGKPVTPLSGVPFEYPLEVRDTTTQKILFTFKEGTKLFGFDQYGNAENYGTIISPRTNPLSRKVEWIRFESRFQNFQPHGYGRQETYDEQENLLLIEEGQFISDPLEPGHYLLNGPGTIRDEKTHRQICTGFFKKGKQHGPGMKIPMDKEIKELPKTREIYGFFDNGRFAEGTPVVFFDAQGKMLCSKFTSSKSGQPSALS